MTIDVYEVDQDTEIETLLSKEELETAKFTLHENVEVVYNFKSAQVIIKKDNEVTIIPLQLLREADKFLHKEYWRLRKEQINGVSNGYD